MVYPTSDTYKDIVPVRDELNMDHNKIMKRIEKNPGARFADVAQEYFE